MKKIIISLLVVIPLFCGCTNIDTTLTLNKDKSAKVVSVLNYKGDINEKGDYQAETILNNLDKFLDKDYKTEINNEDEISRIKAEKSVKNIKKNDIDLSSLGFKTNNSSGKFVDVKKNFFVTSYNIDMTYNMKNQIKKVELSDESTSTSGGLKPEYFQKYGENLVGDGRADFVANFESNSISEDDAKLDTEQKTDEQQDLGVSSVFNIKVPSVASFNNADKVDGTMYSWYIKVNEPTNIELQYIVYSGWAICFLFFAGIAFLVYLARRILRHDSLKRIGNKN